MATGVRIRNSSGTIQIDDQYFNYAIIATGQLTLSLPASGSPYVAASATVRFAAQSPMIAIQSPNGNAVVGAVTPAGAGLWDVTILGGAVAVTYFVLDQCPQQGSHGVGMRLRRASDQKITFDSGFYYPKVVFAGTATKNDMAAASYAVICAQGGGYMNAGAQPPNNYEYITAYRTTSTGVIVSNDQPLRAWGAGISMVAVNARFLMLDVSNVFT
ncbi:hypothetical protein P3W24_04050 [Luteibacter sp. PPL201]|uniref:DUF1983 domain-containing protein n=1 Tax=Luteibacter sahnii TaxID=3021977 RepID=A0ABT6B7S9_9GAMM